MQPLPILFLGDGPTLHTGLARIGRNLAANLSQNPHFRVGYLGRGGQISRKMPFQQYVFQPTEQDQWGAGSLAEVVQDFCPPGDGPMVIFTVWDPSRLTWLGAAQYSKGQDDALDSVLFDPRVRKWGYFAIDGYGAAPNGALTGFLSETLAGYDRVLAYTAEGAEVIRRSWESVGKLDSGLTHLPHGISLSRFQPRSQEVARASLNIPLDACVVGCVMANQPRKDWGLWAQIGAQLKQRVPNLRLLVKVDSLDRHWDLRALCQDLEIGSITTIITEDVSDEKMAWFYAACDLTILPSLGEGFGYPIAESLACGVGVVAGAYFPGIGADLPIHRVQHAEIRIDTRWNVLRPVYGMVDWVTQVFGALADFQEGAQALRIECVRHLDWNVLWPRWRSWFEEGLTSPDPSPSPEEMRT